MALAPDKNENVNIEETKNIEELKKLYNHYIGHGNVYRAMKMLDRITQVCLETNQDRPAIDVVLLLNLYLSPEFKYENYVNQYHARRISEVTLFILYLEIRRKSFHQSFAPSRTILTPHRRRQLDKTANFEPRIFGYGFNRNSCLGVPTPTNAFVDIPNEIDLPPVYQVRMSSNHSVFWCHNNQFFAAGDSRNFTIKTSTNEQHYTFQSPVEIELQIPIDEWITGFKCLECGTLFETEKRWYFVGDYVQAKTYLKVLHNTDFKLANEGNPAIDNFWVSTSRPTVSCLIPKLDDPKNAVSINHLGTHYMVKLFPSYWTELDPRHVKQRPICYLLEGVEVKEVRISNSGRNDIIWVLHDKILYHGKMMLMLKDENDGNERNLDNYIMLVELYEFQTHSTYSCTGVVANNEHGVIFKCGDYPDNGHDYMKLAEDRYRGVVHNYMFETVETYKEHAHNDLRYIASKKKSENKITFDIINTEADWIYKSAQLREEIKMDYMGRTLKEYRWSNYYSFLCYISMPRLPGGIPKCFSTDIDTMISSEDVEFVARHRIKRLFEEFERVNYPGTDVWKPVDFLRIHTEPVEDNSSEGAYRLAAVQWSIREFVRQMMAYKKHSLFNADTDPINKIICEYVVHTLWYAHDMWAVIYNTSEPPSAEDEIVKFLKDSEKTIPDGELLFETLDPGTIFQNRKREGLIVEADLEQELDIEMTFLMQHRDPSLKPTRFSVMTCTYFLCAQNSFLMGHVDKTTKVLDLNKVYPNDRKLDRLVVQTHFHTLGYTDFEGLLDYEDTTFRSLGYGLMAHHTYLKRGLPQQSGFLGPLNRKNFPVTQLAGLQPVSRFDFALQTIDGTLYIHRLLRTLYSANAAGESLPTNLPTKLMMAAWRGLLNKREFDELSMDENVRIAHWYKRAKMHEAFMDHLKYCVLEATQTTDAPQIRELVRFYPTIMQRLIAQYRPAMLLWYHVPLPIPKLRHLKIILEMFPKNEFGRHPRVPRKLIVNPDGTVEKSVYHQIGSRALRRLYITEEEKRAPRFSKSMNYDFPLPFEYKPFNITTLKQTPCPQVASNAPLIPDRLQIADTTQAEQAKKKGQKTPQEIREEQQRAYRQEMQRLAENRAANGSRVRKTKKNRRR